MYGNNITKDRWRKLKYAVVRVLHYTWSDLVVSKDILEYIEGIFCELKQKQTTLKKEERPNTYN